MAREGIPPVAIEWGAKPEGHAQFDPASWTMTLSKDVIERDEISADSFATLVDNAVHETQHTVTTYRGIRVALATERFNPEVAIPGKIVGEAIAANKRKHPDREFDEATRGEALEIYQKQIEPTPIGPVERGEVSREGVLARLDAASKSLRNAERLRREAAKELGNALTTLICSSTRPKRKPPTRTPSGRSARRTTTTSGWSRKPRRGVGELGPGSRWRSRSPCSSGRTTHGAKQMRRSRPRRRRDGWAIRSVRGSRHGRGAKPKRSNGRRRPISMCLARARRPSSSAVTSSSARFRSPRRDSRRSQGSQKGIRGERGGIAAGRCARAQADAGREATCVKGFGPKSVTGDTLLPHGDLEVRQPREVRPRRTKKSARIFIPARRVGSV